MKILITGSTGFIGSHLLARLLKDGHDVHVIVRSSTSAQQNSAVKTFVYSGKIDELVSFMNKEKFDGVIHLASLFLARHEQKDIENLINSNVRFGTELLEAGSRSNKPWFINTGTFWQHYQSKPYSPVNLYAATKQAFEDISKYYVEGLGMNIVTLKLNDTFGSGDTRAKIFNLFLKHAESGQPLEMSPGKQLMDMSYIENVIDGYVKLAQLLNKDSKCKYAGSSFAIRAPKRLPLKGIAAVFEKVTGKKLNIVWGAKEYRPREVMVPWNKGKLIPGWKPRISLEKGIKLTFTAKK